MPTTINLNNGELHIGDLDNSFGEIVTLKTSNWRTGEGFEVELKREDAIQLLDAIVDEFDLKVLTRTINTFE